MAKSPIHGISDTPWHVEYIHMDEKDARRDKRRCIYFQSDEDTYNHCSFSHSVCMGSTYCKHYKENREAQRAKQQERQKLVKDAQMMTISPKDIANTVCYGDTVRLQDTLTKEMFAVDIEQFVKKEKLAAIVPALVGKHLNEQVSFKRHTYQIVSIFKPEVANDCAFDLPKRERINGTAKEDYKEKTTVNVIKTKVPGMPTVTVRKKVPVKDTFKAWIIEDYARYCRIDLTELCTRNVPVKKKRGGSQNLKLLYCPCCDRYFIHAVYEDSSVNLKDFDIVINELTPRRIKMYQNELNKKNVEKK